MPLLISNDIKVYGLRRGCIEIDQMKPLGVEIGFGQTRGLRKNMGFIFIGKTGKICFHGTALMNAGTSIRVDNGVFEVGDKFSSGNDCFFSCSKGISIGEDVMLGWNINIRDSDGHPMFHDGNEVASLKQVVIGSHVWIASYADILKGVVIPDGCAIAYRSCLTKCFDEENSLIAGCPAKIIRSDIGWKR